MCELLSPAGDMECLKAAVCSGADAVYIGGMDFSARSFAKNFSREEISSAADYCHIRGVKLYTALNTMILERELASALEEAAFLDSIGIDAVIVSDIGLAGLIKKHLPIPVHASTQMCIHNSDGAKLLKDKGFSRVVPARELSVSEIEAMAKCGIEIEVFIHGALCSGVSGLCLMSSCIGCRSGNRGKCAQPCRLPYKINGEEKYFLSTADLCAVRYMKSLMDAGVCSFKIEGRMKPASYVAGVTEIYRDVISAVKNGEKPGAEYEKRLFKHYNRTFTASYLEGRDTVCATDRPGNRKKDVSVNPGAAPAEEKIFHFLTGAVELTENSPAVFSVAGDKIGGEISCVGEKPLETALKPLDEDSVKISLSKTGGTPFKFTDIAVSVSGRPFISKAELNNLRRTAVDAAENAILSKYKKDAVDVRGAYDFPRIQHELKYLYVETSSAGLAVMAAAAGADRIYFAPRDYSYSHLKHAAEIMNGQKIYPYIRIVPFLRENDFKYVFENISRVRECFSGVLCGSISQTAFAGMFDNAVIDYTANIANSASAAEARAQGFNEVTLSHELAKRDLLALKSECPTEIVAYGYLPVMWIAHEIFSKTMTDRKGYMYRLFEYKTPRSLYTVNNPVLLAVKELMSIGNNIDAVRLKAEEKNDMDAVIGYRRAIDEKTNMVIDMQGTTQGHLKRGV